MTDYFVKVREIKEQESKDYYYYYYYYYYRISQFSALAGKYSLILGYSNQQD